MKSNSHTLISSTYMTILTITYLLDTYLLDRKKDIFGN